MIDVRRIGSATLNTGDLGRSLVYFSELLGLVLLDRTLERAVLATPQGLEVLVLEQGGEPGVTSLSFQIAPNASLDEAAIYLNGQGIVTSFASDTTPGVARTIQFVDPHGTKIELFSEYTFSKRYPRQIGIMPLKLGHAAAVAPEIGRIVDFYTQHLGFRISDWRPDAAYFLRCNVDHHTLNFFRNASPGFHHLAFELNDWADLHRACDLLAANGYLMEWGPGRHIIGHNIACYHRNSDGLRIELYTELDQMKDEALGYFEPRPWHEDTPQRPKAWPPGTSSNYWGRHQIRADDAE